MNKKQFKKKYILGLIKTYHAKKRQVERDISDQLLIKILSEGEFQDREDNGKVVVFEGYQVYLSYDLDAIITVVAPSIPPNSPKALSRKVGLKIKNEIKEKVSSTNEEIEDELSFEEYIKKGLF